MLTRMYSPDQFGVLSIYTVILSLAAIFSCLSYEAAIVLPSNEIDASKLLNACFIISCMMTGFSSIVVYFASDEIVRYFESPGLRSVLFWTPLTFLSMGLFQAFNYWNTRLKRFKRLSASKVCIAGVTNVFQIGGGFVGGGSNVLIYGQIVGLLASWFVMAYDSIRSQLRQLVNDISKPSMTVRVLNQYRNFPMYMTWGTLMNTAAFQSVPILLFKYYGSSVVGYYYIASRVVSIPMSLIGNAVGQVLLQRVSTDVIQKRSISKLIAKVIGVSAALWIPLFGVLAVILPGVFSIFFGSEWETAGRYAQALIPLFLLQLIASPVSVVLISLNKQRVVAILQMLLLASALLTLSITRHLSGDAFFSLMVYSICQSVIYFVYLMVIVRYSSTSVREIIRETRSILNIQR